MYKFHSLLFLLIIIFNNYKSIAQEDCSAIIRGYYFLKNKNEPVVNATVNLLNPIDSSIIKTTLTNDFGFFEFKNNCFGIYLLKANVINTDKNISQVEVKEKVKNLIIHIQKNLEELNEVVVTKIKNRNPGLKVELTSKLFEESKGQSLAQALSKLSGVSTLQTGSTISKPVIHGLHSSRILIFNNGVKLEGQQWGSDHAPEVDAFSAQKLSVSKGASNLIYGGDALGGVVIVELKDMPKDKKLHGDFSSVFMSNNLLYGFSTLLEQNLKKKPFISWRVQGSYKQGGNARTPLYYTQNTGINEWNISAQLEINKRKYKADLFLDNYHNKLGIFTGSNYGNIDDLLNAIKQTIPVNNKNEFSYKIQRPFQNVNHFTFKYNNELYISKNKANSLTTKYSYQNNHRQEFDYAVITTAPELDLTLQTHLLDIYYQKKGKINLTFGFNSQIQLNNWTGARFFIPQYQLYSYGAYGIVKKNISLTQKIEYGIRYDFKSLTTQRNNTRGVYSQQINFNNFSASFLYEKSFNRFNKLIFNTSVASRPPNVNELFVKGLHQGTASYEIGDSNLKIETAFNNVLEYNFYFNEEKNNLVISIYGNFIKDFINISAQPQPIYTIRGAFTSFKYYQTNALFTGIDLNLDLTLYRRLSSTINSTFLLARDLKANDWLPQIPPNKFSIDFNYAYKQLHQDNNYFKLTFAYNFKQFIIPKVYYDFLPPPNGYLLVNIDYGYYINKKLNIGAGISNLLNTRYRDYLNRFRYFTDALGINVFFRLNYKFIN